MFPPKSLLSLLFISLAGVDASPLSRRDGKATLGFATKFNEPGNPNFVEGDRAHVQSMKQGNGLGKRTPVITTNTGMNYTVQVGVGSPPTNYTLLLDTATSLTWVGAHKKYVATESSHDTGHHVSAAYSYGTFSGEEWIDTITLSPDLVVNQQSIGVATQVTGFAPDVDGYLGLGPLDLTENHVDGESTVPTVMDNLCSQGTISEEVLGIYFKPDVHLGELTFGGYDESAIRGPMSYSPVTTTSPASEYWGTNLSIDYGGDAIMSMSAGIFDTGSAFIFVPTDVFEKYMAKTSATRDAAIGLLTITSEQYGTLEPLTFHIGDVPFVLTPNAQIWPRSRNYVFGGSPDKIYLVVADFEGYAKPGFEFVLGHTFLERYYSVFDTPNNRIGLAPTDYTHAELS
ncbi:aspartic peptidase domain-containing protein [Boletus edulis BED1]|uniref:Aspartic peptidase domain-containing protein n=1 Tax=Boletus edulis BED1 TaxID=1328754 RepID=A0AAD4BC44_BOLED|nr:aspartic peptidase domain-containing protein [Boletus edulis BED1]